MSDSSTPVTPGTGPVLPGPTPTGYQRSQGGTSFKWVPPTPEHLSKLLPQYEIEALIGRGGMGAVYRGKQKALDRTVAIKILPPEVDDEDASYTERFKNEAKIMARLEHPAIVPVYDFGETSEGQLYFVMSFVNGTDVHQMVQSKGRLPPEHALAITAHVCDALTYAHAHGVIHRDIKPSNVLINMEGQVKVADFGLAKVDDPSQSSGLTKTGLAMGTPDYVAPETLTLGMIVDGRADLYAVGVMLYQMLTGNVPRGMFTMPSVMIGSDPRFDAIIAKAMKYDREERYLTATDLRRDLDVILTTPLVQAGGQSSAAIPMQACHGVKQGNPVAPQLESSPKRHDPEKAKTPRYIGAGAAAAAVVIALYAFIGGKNDKPEPSPTKTTLDIKMPNESSPVAPQLESKPKTTPTDNATKPDSTASTSSSELSGDEPKPGTTLPPAITTASKPAKPAEKFPPGKWVKVLTSFDELPENLRSPDSGVKFQDGWLNFEKPGAWNLSPGQLGANHAIRVRIKPGKGHTSLTIRKPSIEVIDGYQIQEKGDSKVRGVAALPRAQGAPLVLEGTWPRPSATDSSVMELGIVGNRLVTRVEASVLSKAIEQPKQGTGVSIFCQKEAIRDIEVINLDGIPEAEALKILGVDEKGNDLRQKPAAVASTSPSPTATTTAPISNAAPAAFPPGQWVKVFTKFEDLPERLRKPDSGVKIENGKLIIAARSSQSIKFPTEFSNVGLRLKQAPNSPETQVRLSKSDTTDIRLLARPSGDEVSCMIWKPGAGNGLGNLEAPRVLERTLELVVVGRRVVARVNDQIFSAELPTGEMIGPFNPEIFFNNSSVRDIEVINLDGLSEAEALSTLGVDEKGNDRRQVGPIAATPPAPSVSPSQSLPVSKPPSPAFPPGQWVKVFTKVEDLPGHLRNADSAVKWENGALRVSMDGAYIGLSPATGNLKNCALRARIDGKFTILLNDADNLGHYAFWRNSIDINQQQAGNKQWAKRQHQTFPAPTLEEPHRWEFAIIGSKLVVRCDDKILAVGSNNEVPGGKIKLEKWLGTIRDIEVINLDGIPEAEALRILGIDEKGNDTRAAALATEKQAMEQKQVAQAAAGIPELAALDEQFKKLTAERVTAPFEADLAKLNSGYLGGIDRKIAEERGKGNLDGVLALEEEKKLVEASSGTRSQMPDGVRLPTGASTGDVPATDSETTPATLRGLRQIYREAFAKLDTTRATNLKLLTEPLSIRLKQLESTLTQSNRIEHAKTVRDYRENLGEGVTTDESTDAPARSTLNGGTAAKMEVADKGARTPASKLSPEEIVKWVLSRQGKVTIDKSGQKTTIEAGISIPSGSFKITRVDFLKTKDPRDPIPDSELENLSGLKEMQELHLQGRSGFTGSFLASLVASRDLVHLNISESSFQPEHMTSLSLFPNLTNIRVAGGRVAEALSSLPPLRKLGSLAIHGVPTPEMLQSLTKHPELTDLKCISRDWKVEHFRAMAGIKTLTSLELQSLPLEPETFVILAPLTKLESVYIPVNIKAGQLSGLEALKNLKRIALSADSVTGDVEGLVGKLPLFRSLEKVELQTGTAEDPKLIKAVEVIQKALSKAKVVLRRP